MLGRHRSKSGVLSALSLAALAGLSGTSSGAFGADLSSYYINAIVSTVAPVGKALALGVDATQVSLSPTAPTVTVPLGDYLSYGIAAVLTNNINPQAGVATSDGQGGTIVQPTNLGIANIGYRVNNVSPDDLNGSLLQPVLNGARQTPGEFFSTAVIGGKGIGSTPPSGYPTPLLSDLGDVEPNSGTVASTFQIFQSSTDGIVSPNPTGMEILQEFASATGGAANAATAFDSLGYQALGTGVVELYPAIDPTATQYFAETAAGSASVTASYRATYFSSSDTINPLPALTVVIGPSVPEPASIGLLGIAAMALLGQRRGREKMAE
jgi:hypothetical protein